MQDRETTFLLARPERWLLRAIAARLPGFVAARPSDGARAGRGRRVRRGRRDGALLDGGGAARRALVRRLAGRDAGAGAPAERPRYGYYVDHLADAFATALVGLGLGLSTSMHLAAGLVLVIAYLALSINSYLETQALRAVLARLRAARADRGADRADRAARASWRSGVEVSWLGLTLLDVVALGGAGVMLRRAGGAGVRRT